MSELLTTKQVQDILKIDRITVYRMLDDGRLKGVKIGNQWRFAQSEIDRLLGKEIEEEEEAIEIIPDFPSSCVTEVQEIFAGIIGIGAVTVTMQGTPLTEPTYSNPFCKLMLSSEAGNKACQNSWRRITENGSNRQDCRLCHAGLCYKRAMIQSDGRQIAWLIAGQFYMETPDREENEKFIGELAEKYQLPKQQLIDASRKIPLLKKYQLEQVQEWTPKVAGTVQSILCERADLIGRLKRIAELSSIDASLSK